MAYRPFYSCVLSYLAMNASEAGVDLALIQTSRLLSCKCYLVSIRTTWFAQWKQWGLYQNKVNTSLAAIQRPSHQAENCKMVYCLFFTNALVYRRVRGVLSTRVFSAYCSPLNFPVAAFLKLKTTGIYLSKFPTAIERLGVSDFPLYPLQMILQPISLCVNCWLLKKKPSKGGTSNLETSAPAWSFAAEIWCSLKQIFAREAKLRGQICQICIKVAFDEPLRWAGPIVW